MTYVGKVDELVLPTSSYYVILRANTATAFTHRMW
jgi:hypothetical protein